MIHNFADPLIIRICCTYATPIILSETLSHIITNMSVIKSSTTVHTPTAQKIVADVVHDLVDAVEAAEIPRVVNKKRSLDSDMMTKIMVVKCDEYTV